MLVGHGSTDSSVGYQICQLASRANMDWNIEYNEPQGVVRLDLYGRYAADDTLKAFSEVTSKPYWQPGTPLLIDNTSVDVSEMRMMQVEEATDILETFEKQFGSSRIATVAGSDLQYGLARQFIAFIDGRVSASFNVFHDDFSALNWLSKAQTVNGVGVTK